MWRGGSWGRIGAAGEWISWAVQSLDDSILPVLGGLHDAGGARRAFAGGAGGGVDNVSVDLMYGLPGRRRGSDATVAGVLGWETEHLSAYGLTLDRAALGGHGRGGAAGRRRGRRAVRALARAAGERGYEHTRSRTTRGRVPLAAQPDLLARGRVSRLRSGACGFVGDMRYGNASLSALLRDAGRRRLPIDSPSGSPRASSSVSAYPGLRLSDGIPRAWPDERLAGDPAPRPPRGRWRESASSPSATTRGPHRGRLPRLRPPSSSSSSDRHVGPHGPKPPHVRRPRRSRGASLGCCAACGSACGESPRGGSRRVVGDMGGPDMAPTPPPFEAPRAAVALLWSAARRAAQTCASRRAAASVASRRGKGFDA